MASSSTANHGQTSTALLVDGQRGSFRTAPNRSLNYPHGLLRQWPPASEAFTLGGVRQGPEIAQYQHLDNCIPDIPTASPCSLCSKAKCAYPELWRGLVLHCAPGMTRTYIAKETYGGLGLAVGPLSRMSCCKLSQCFLRIASTLKPF